MAYADRTLTCVECGSEFTFTADDQEFHARKGYQDPRRCPTCRASRRASGGGGFGGGRSSYTSAREMFDVTCDSCGTATQVPFQPRLDRPVYCSDCFSKVKPARTGRSW